MKIDNYIVLSGKLIDKLVFDHEIYGEKFYRTYCGCNRTSGYRDSVPIIISERLLYGVPMTLNCPVEIEGQIRTHNYLKDGKSVSNIYIFATDFKISDEVTYFNEAMLVGYVCRKAEYRETTGGRVVADLLLAINRAHRKSDYVPIIVWGRNAKFARNIEVGEKFKVKGRLQSRNYTKKLEDGTSVEKIAYELSVSELARMEEIDK